jgi:(1->4)-alpha-D-glucan 1-alpha-D-glucosylmutase
MSDLDALRRLAGQYGIEPDWHDIWGQRHEVPEASLRALLAAMQVPAVDDAAVHASLHARHAQTWRRRLPSVLVARAGVPSVEVMLRSPAAAEDSALAWHLALEDGSVRTGRMVPAMLPELERSEVDGELLVARRFGLGGEIPMGYHALELHGPEGTVLGSMRLVVAPERCYQPEAVRDGGRVWGPAVQLYALNSQRNWGIGDFQDLRTVLEDWGARGAAVVGLNPLHALFPHDPERASPYSPSSRLFLNVLYLAPELIEDFQECEAARRLAASAGYLSRLERLREAPLVGYAEAAQAKFELLSLLYTNFRERHLGHDTARARGFRAFQQRGGPALRLHALFEALQEHFHRGDPTVWGWPAWPEDFRQPGSDSVEAFAREHVEEIEFREWLQWQADLQLAGVGLRSLELGLGVGLYGDLAVSVDRGGAEAWANQALYALGAGVGAPPDDFNLQGQNWGLPPPSPDAMRDSAYALFVAMLRANMRHTGALRIDHVMGLMRLFWIPEGAAAAHGAYVRYPAEDLLAIVALESHRNRCMVIGEDLGTVPDSVRHALAAADVLSYRLLYFERRDGGDFKSPGEYPAEALVAVSTHDLPTLAGFWAGRDLRVRQALGLYPSLEVQEQQVLARTQDRVRLLAALQREGLLPEGTPLDPAATPEMTHALARGVHAYLARARSKLMMVQLEDVVCAPEQVNLPGTTNEYPNWRRKIPLPLEQWPANEPFAQFCRALETERARWVATRTPANHGRTTTGACIPLATYRLQMHKGFGFRDAANLVPYLAELGVSHVYCSPYLRARAGSTHGYDIIDHGALNPEIGSEADFDHFVAQLRAHGLRQILDLAPNHMGVMGADNAWWMDVLENGPASARAAFFDIDWEPINPALAGKVLVPVLGDHYGSVLERGEIALRYEHEYGGFAFWYFEHRFPVDPREYPRVLERVLRALPPQALQPTARAELESLVSAFSHLPPRHATDSLAIEERKRDKEVHKRRLAAQCDACPALRESVEAVVRAINGTPGRAASFDALHELLEAQAFRLAYWRVASDEINYRRFFDINDLAALRTENDTVFEATHQLVLELVRSGKVDGLRVDHPDGLHDPARYFHHLQARVAAVCGRPGAVRGRGEALPLYLVVEKITAGHEHVPQTWPIHGTTGSRFANLLNGVFVETVNRARFARIWKTFTGRGEPYEEVVYQAKRLVLRSAMASELNVLTNFLARIAQADRATRDYTLNTLRQALTEVIACFPVYRSYVGDRVSAQDRRYIEWAVARAKRRSRASDTSIFDFVRAVLLRERPGVESMACGFVHRFQQLTAPVNAKGVEDTAFYRHGPLVSLNEVGGDPDRFGVTLRAFHGASQDRARSWPHTMLATSTHDSKRSEDVRARLNALSEMPAAWRLALRRWSRINRSRKTRLEDGLAPSAADEYLLYQTLLGTWPAGPLDEQGLARYRARIQAYVIKAVREAKLHSSWINVNAPYESAVAAFVEALVGRLENNLFLDDFLVLQRTVAWLGVLNGLSQTLVKLVSPGVPDIYQGNELWDFSLVDPDNRRPVDFDLRRSLLAEVRQLAGEPLQRRAAALSAMLRQPEDGRCKLYLTRASLGLRQRRSALFLNGDYLPLLAEGIHATRVIAFGRRRGEAGVLAVAPRFHAGLIDRPGVVPLGAQAWGDTVVPADHLPEGATLTDVLTGRTVPTRLRGGRPVLPLSEVLTVWPVALLEYDAPAAEARV